jgi:tetratricopeptide (TPR) repeat protein
MKTLYQYILKSKPTKIAVLTTILFGFSSCEKYLDIEPLASISDEAAIVDETSLRTAVRGAYRALADNGYYGSSYTLQGFVPSGNVVYQVFNNLQDLNFLPEDGTFQSSWNAIYRSINIANNIILYAPQINDVNLTTDERNELLGEAHFIRALAYFDLAKAFGGVPIKLTPTAEIVEGAKLPRATREQTYAQVLSDLETAEGLLKENVNRIRATKHSVWALRARYHLYNQQWGEAIEYANKVLSLSADYELLNPFTAWFKNNVIQTRESIFELAYSPLNTNGLRTPMSLQARGGEYRFRPSDELLITLRTTETGGARIALLDSATQSGTTLYAGSLYYRSPATDPVYVLRIAEQYLIRAEARAQLGDLPGALSDLNIIRSRANLADSEAESQTEILDAILEERRLEFLWEGHRYFDLTRTGKLQEEIARLKPNLTITSKQNLFPIPANEVIIGNLTQNPGY